MAGQMVSGLFEGNLWNEIDHFYSKGFNLASVTASTWNPESLNFQPYFLNMQFMFATM